MAKISLLLDTDIFIDYFNTGRFHALFDSDRFQGLLIQPSRKKNS